MYNYRNINDTSCCAVSILLFIMGAATALHRNELSVKIFCGDRMPTNGRKWIIDNHLVGFWKVHSTGLSVLTGWLPVEASPG